MPQLVLECPHCFTERSGFEFVSEYPYRQDRTRHPETWITFWSCRTCGEAVIAKFRATYHEYSPAQALNDPRSDDFVLIETHPKFQQFRAPEHVPEVIGKDFNEAQDSLRRQNWTSAGMMFRKVLARSTTMLAPEDVDFASLRLMNRIDELAKRHLITAAMQDWAHIIRLDGNEATHEEDEAFTDHKAKQLKEFTELFLIYAFTLPARVQAFRGEADPNP